MLSNLLGNLFLAALLEYAAILLLLKKKRKPLMKLEQGMKNIIDNAAVDDPQARRELMKKPVSCPTFQSMKLKNLEDKKWQYSGPVAYICRSF